MIIFYSKSGSKLTFEKFYLLLLLLRLLAVYKVHGMALEPIDEARGRLKQLLSKLVAGHANLDLFFLTRLGTRQPKQNVP